MSKKFYERQRQLDKEINSVVDDFCKKIENIITEFSNDTHLTIAEITVKQNKVIHVDGSWSFPATVILEWKYID